MKRFWPVLVILILIAGGYIAFRVYRQNQNARAASSLQTETIARGSLTATVGATGTVRANQTAVLPWQTSGSVEKVNFKVGDKVNPGDLLANLKESSLGQNIIMARADLASSQKSLDDLMNSQTPKAQALQTVDTAQKALDDYTTSFSLQQAQAKQGLLDAQDAFDEAKRQRNNLNGARASQDTLDTYQAKYNLAQSQLDQAQAAYDRVTNLPEDNPTRSAARVALDNARKARDQALATWNWYKGTSSETDFAKADAKLAQAQAKLDEAQRAYDRIKDGPNPTDKAILEAQLADAQRSYNLIKDGPDVNDIEALQARISAAKATLAMTKLEAPFGGTVTMVDVKPGDQIAPGSTAVQIDDLSHLFVDVSVSEVDINRIQPGQSVTMTFDAINNVSYNGKVTEVSEVGAPVQGVVSFSVTVELTNPDKQVKPGMTAAVNIVVDQLNDVLMVPNRAVRLQDSQRIVYVLRDGNSTPVKVELGVSSDTMSEVTGGDLRVGDLVVLNPPVTFQTSGGSPFGRNR